MFENILGHDNVKKQITSDFNAQKVSHAYLFSGIEGIGKKTLLLLFTTLITSLLMIGLILNKGENNEEKEYIFEKLFKQTIESSSS